MEKKKTEIAVNTSSGAEKVETIKEVKKDGAKTKTAQKKTVRAKGDAAMGDSVKTEKKISAKKLNARSTDGKAEREAERAKARVEAALKRKEEQAKKKELRAEKAAERAKARQAAAEKRRAELKALEEKYHKEREERIRERAHRKANRRQAANKKQRTHKKREDGGENRNKGYGGWIAAVVALGTVTLALATAVTVGAIDMKNKNDGIMTANKSTMYEVIGIMENVDGDLDRVRVSNSPAQQSRILTDLLVQARLAEADLEKLPIAAETNSNITVFVNRTATEAERMLAKLRRGESLSKQDGETLERLYQTNRSIRAQLDEFRQKMTDEDIWSFMKKGEGMVKDVLKNLEELTMEENRIAKGEKAPETGTPLPERQKEAAVDTAKAEELCNQYFVDYSIKEFQCVGETATKNYRAYNVQGYDEKGSLLFAEISQADGALLRFDYYEDCKVQALNIDNAEDVAEKFLGKLGYDDLTVVRVRESGSSADFTFVYEKDDVAYYPDEIRVKVCRERGVISGFDATKYLQNHHTRVEPSVKISLAQAYDKLHDKLEVQSARLAVVKAGKEEKTAYEFLCSYGEESYFVYLSAADSEEISIVNAKVVY